MKNLYIFDLDGTVRRTKSGGLCPNVLGDQEILPGVEEKIMKFRQQGNKFVVCSNQGGVSHGYLTERDAWLIAEETNKLLGHPFTDIRLAFYHPKGKFKDKYPPISKPNPEILIDLVNVFCVRYLLEEEYRAGKQHIFFIGDGFTDQEAAANANKYLYNHAALVQIKFIWAHEFFGWPEDQVEKTNFGYSLKRSTK